MAATVPLALSLVLRIALASGPDDLPAAAPACPGTSMAQAEQSLGAGRRYAFAGPMTAPFLRLWTDGDRPALPVPPDSITVLAEPEAPLLILYGFRGCALGALRTTRPQLYQAMRASIGPAV